MVDKVKFISFAKVLENWDRFLRISKVSFSSISKLPKTTLKNSNIQEVSKNEENS